MIWAALRHLIPYSCRTSWLQSYSYNLEGSTSKGSKKCQNFQGKCIIYKLYLIHINKKWQKNIYYQEWQKQKHWGELLATERILAGPGLWTIHRALCKKKVTKSPKAAGQHRQLKKPNGKRGAEWSMRHPHHLSYYLNGPFSLPSVGSTIRGWWCMGPNYRLWEGLNTPIWRRILPIPRLKGSCNFR